MDACPRSLALWPWNKMWLHAIAMKVCSMQLLASDANKQCLSSFLYTCANQYSATVFKFLSLSSFLLFTTLSGELSVAFCSFWTPSNSFSSTHEVCWTLPGFFLYYYPGTFLRQWAGAIIGLILFISCPLRIFVLHSLMPIVLKIVSCICPLLQMGWKSFLCYSILSRCLAFCWCFLYFCCCS